MGHARNLRLDSFAARRMIAACSSKISAQFEFPLGFLQNASAQKGVHADAVKQ